MTLYRFCSSCLGLVAVLITFEPAEAEPAYRWLGANSADKLTLSKMISAPPGFKRVQTSPGTWAHWLRGLPMKPHGSPVNLYTGAPKWRQDVHQAVIDIDVGKRDLQQCADAIMRLRAEWLFQKRTPQRIAFNNTKGKPMVFQSRKHTSYTAFRKYMTRVFAYAGTYSLERELKPKKIADIAIGDVFIKGGFPGHAVLVADMVHNPETGAKKFLLMQSYMPAQDMHILRNPNRPDSPWYDVIPGTRLVTPEWEFDHDALRTWPRKS